MKRKFSMIILICFSFLFSINTIFADPYDDTPKTVPDFDSFDKYVDALGNTRSGNWLVEKGNGVGGTVTKLPGGGVVGGTTSPGGIISYNPGRIDRDVSIQLIPGGGGTNVIHTGLWLGIHAVRFYIVDNNGMVLSNSVDFVQTALKEENVMVGLSNYRGGYGTKLGIEYYGKTTFTPREEAIYNPSTLSGLPTVIAFQGSTNNPLANYITGMSYSSLLKFLSNFKLENTTADQMIEQFKQSGTTGGDWYYLVAEPVIISGIKDSDGNIKNYALTATEIAMLFEEKDLSKIPEQADLLLKQLQNSLYVANNIFQTSSGYRIKGVSPASSNLTKSQSLNGNGYGMNIWGLRQIVSIDPPDDNCGNPSYGPTMCAGYWEITTDQFDTYEHANFECVYNRKNGTRLNNTCTIHCTEDIAFDFPREMNGAVPAGSNFWPDTNITITGTRVCRTNVIDLKKWWNDYINATDKMRENWVKHNIAREEIDSCKSKEEMEENSSGFQALMYDINYTCSNDPNTNRYAQKESDISCPTNKNGPGKVVLGERKACGRADLTVYYESNHYADYSMESNSSALGDIFLGVAKISYSFTSCPEYIVPSADFRTVGSGGDAYDAAKNSAAIRIRARLREMCDVQFNEGTYLGAYNTALGTRTRLINEIKACNDFPMDYSLKPNVTLQNFYYYGSKVQDLRLTRDLFVTPAVKNAYATEQYLKSKTYKDLWEWKDMAKCTSKSISDPKCGVEKTYLPWNQIIEKRMKAGATNFKLPAGTFQYILKPEGMMVSNIPTGHNYRDLGRPGLPTRASDPLGTTYQYEFGISNLGHNGILDPLAASAPNDASRYYCTYAVDCTTITCPPENPRTCGAACEPIKKCNPLIQNCDQSDGLNIKFRTISLTEPFPGTDGKGRIPGSNWVDSGYRGSYNYATWEANYGFIADYYINNNRGVDDYEVYNKDPMYEITLTPALIKEIREYNETHKYDDFNLSCERGTGLACKSEFVRQTFETSFENRCGMNNDFYFCDGANGDNHARNWIRGYAY